MIVRYHISCPGCDSIIRLRLSVGLEREQPFYFVCKECKAVTRGKLKIKYEPKPEAELELDEGDIVGYEKEPNQSINIHPSFPSISDAREISDYGGSPFLMHHQLLGDRFLEVNRRLNIFCECKDKDWLRIRRWIGFYIDRNWQSFDNEGQGIFEEQWPKITDNWQRHDIIHKMLDIFLLPWFVEPYYVEMKTEWCNLPVFQNPPALLYDFIEQCAGTDELRNAQRDIFHCLEQFVENTGGLLPGISVLLYDNNNRPQNLRLFRDDFPQLRDLYVAIFETCHKLLKYVLVVVNIQERKSVVDFGLGRRESLQSFDRLSSANKIMYLDCLPIWQTNWQIVLDRDIRNAISHRSIRHDLPSGNLIIGREEIAYIDFVSKCVLLIHPVFAMMNAVKTLLIAKCFHDQS